MKLIVIYASAGAGHTKSAQAIYQYFKENNSSLDIQLVDALDYSSIFFKENYAYGYTFLIKYTLWLWALSFYITNTKWLRPLVNWLHFVFNRLDTHRLTRFLIRENPDFIISTHFLSSEITAYLKRRDKISSRLITVITDFGVHQFWLYRQTDLYAVACEATKEILLAEGVPGQRVMVSGIPVSPKFLLEHNKVQLCRKFNIRPEKFTVLIMTGSFGIGPIEEIADLLCGNDLQVLVVCARNKTLFERLSLKNYPEVRLFAFIDNIEELMAVSDLIITKPGGLTISELLVMEAVPVFIHAIPGQEMENTKVLAKYGVGLYPRNSEEIKKIILDYKANPDKLKGVRARIRQIRKPFAVQELYDAVYKSGIGPAS